MKKPKGVVAIKVGSLSGIRAFHEWNREFLKANGEDPGPTFEEMLQPVPDYVSKLIKENE